MAYTKQNFQKRQILKAEQLNNMETAIKANETAIANCYTKEDKQTMANDVMSLLPTWTGGSY